jgi:DNA repair protein RadA/Sms
VSLRVSKHLFRCSVCGHIPERWRSQCISCKRAGGYVAVGLNAEPIGSRIKVIGEHEIPDEERLRSNVAVWDKLTDGGQTFGTVILLAGGEGSGKSTLLLEVAMRCSVERTLYVTGEEQDVRVHARARRLGLWDENRRTHRCRVFHTNVTEEIIEAADREHAKLIIVDSAQAFSSRHSMKAKPGSIHEVKRIALKLVEHARKQNTAWILIGQLNQDGKIAGPRKMPHWVDGVGVIKKNDRTGVRRIGMTKWRDGQAHVWYELVMTSQGIVERSDPRAMTALKEGEKTNTQKNIERSQVLDNLFAGKLDNDEDLSPPESDAVDL